MPRTTAAAKKSEPIQAAEAPKIDDTLLAEIIEASDAPTGYLFADPAQVGPMVAAGYVITNPNIVQEGKIAAKATAAGTQYIKENAPDLLSQTENETEEETMTATNTATQADTSANEAKTQRAKPVLSGIVSGLNLAASVSNRRGGARPETYPFSKLEVGEAFFIQATEEVPDPTKAYASTVASATNRYANEVPGKFRTNRKGEQVPELEYTRVFRIVRLDDGAPFGPEFAGKPGAAVERTQ